MLQQPHPQFESSRLLRRRDQSRSTPWSQSVGQWVAHYRVIERIDCGSMGLVCRAVDERNLEFVALKLLPCGWDQNPQSVRRFLRSARAVSALNHPSICHVRDFGQAPDGAPYIAMELCEGETLKRRVRRGPLQFAAAIDLCAQVAAGLEAAHAAGIVHRDIKPANIMICRAGIPKILDFGLAKLLNQVDLTRSGSWVGTPLYMAPEQMTGQPVDCRTDLWSLGTTLYELLTERSAFCGDNPAAVMYSVLQHEPKPVTALRPELPAEIDEVMRRSLAKDPADRYSSAHEMIRGLLGALVDPP